MWFLLIFFTMFSILVKRIGVFKDRSVYMSQKIQTLFGDFSNIPLSVFHNIPVDFTPNIYNHCRPFFIGHRQHCQPFYLFRNGFGFLNHKCLALKSYSFSWSWFLHYWLNNFLSARKIKEFIIFCNFFCQIKRKKLTEKCAKARIANLLRV